VEATCTNRAACLPTLPVDPICKIQRIRGGNPQILPCKIRHTKQYMRKRLLKYITTTKIYQRQQVQPDIIHTMNIIINTNVTYSCFYLSRANHVTGDSTPVVRCKHCQSAPLVHHHQQQQQSRLWWLMQYYSQY
jgi:hypothetical protein